MRRFNTAALLIMFIISLLPHKLYAAGDKEYTAFCKAMSQLTESAGKRFENIMGPLKDSADGIKTWKSKIDLPGIVTSCVKDEMVISRYYRGDFKGLKSEAIKTQYNKYAGFLDKCMIAKGYKLQKMPNEQGTSDFEDIIYRLPDDSPIPIEKRPFIRMTVIYDNTVDLYSISIYVNENFL